MTTYGVPRMSDRGTLRPSVGLDSQLRPNSFFWSNSLKTEFH